MPGTCRRPAPALSIPVLAAVAAIAGCDGGSPPDAVRPGPACDPAGVPESARIGARRKEVVVILDRCPGAVEETLALVLDGPARRVLRAEVPASRDGGRTVVRLGRGGGEPAWRLRRGRYVARLSVAGSPPGPARPLAVAPGPQPELPRGGYRILPRHRVVAAYGAPQAEELGILGIGPPSRAAAALRRLAEPYDRGGRPVLPAFELVATIVTAAPGADGRYRFRQPAATVRRYLAAARRARALLILDIQPGRASFMDEVRALRPFLEQPDVGLALDPEWSMGPGQVPGRVIGHTTARVVNEVSAYLAGIVRRRALPEKLLLVHQFTVDMVRDRGALRRRPGVALVLNVDGFGDAAVKEARYRDLTRGDRLPNGFKLFLREDGRPMAPARVLALRPRPDVVVYE